MTQEKIPLSHGEGGRENFSQSAKQYALRRLRQQAKHHAPKSLARRTGNKSQRGRARMQTRMNSGMDKAPTRVYISREKQSAVQAALLCH